VIYRQIVRKNYDVALMKIVQQGKQESKRESNSGHKIQPSRVDHLQFSVHPIAKRQLVRNSKIGLPDPPQADNFELIP
jgi:hypothetical protein